MVRSPEYILCLLILPLLLLLYSRAAIRRRRLLQLFNREDKAAIPALLVTIALVVLFTLGLTRPYSGKEEFALGKPRAGTMLIVDISQSMLVQDVSPNRLRLTKRKIQDLVTSIKEEIPGLRVGITLFAGASYVYCPPTEDYTLLEVFIRSIQPELITNPGSALQEALLLGARSLKQSKFSSKSMVLFSDGEDYYMNLEKAISLIKENDIPLLAVGVGSDAGGPVPMPRSQSRYYKDRRGNTVISKLSEDSLSALSSETSGIYTKISIDDRDTTALVAFLKAHHKKQFSIEGVDDVQVSTITIFHELGSWVAPLLCLLLCWATWKRQRYLSLWLLLLMVFQSTPSPVTIALAEEIPSLSDAVSAFQQGDFKTARTGFLKAYQEEQKSFTDIMRLAAAEYKLGNYQQASKLYEEAQSKANHGRDLYEALYNRGNALLHSQQFDPAIEEYKKALAVKKADQRATFNMELAEKLKKQKPPQQQKQEKQDQQKEEQEKKEQKDQEQQQQSGQPENSDQEQDKDSGDEQEQDKQNNDQQNQDNKDKDNPDDSKGDNDNQEDEKQDSSDKDSRSENNKEDKKDQDQEDKDQDSDQQDENDEQNNADTDEQQGGNAPDEPQNPSEEDADTKAAKAWLDSLPDSPLIIRSYRGKGSSQGGQLW